MPRFFRQNPHFEEEMAKSEEHRRGLAAAAEPARAKIESLARQIMPRPGDHIVIEDTGESVVIANTEHGWHLDEFGSAKNPPYAPLRRGARASGLRVEDASNR